MKKSLFMVVLIIGVLLTACGQGDRVQGVDMVPVESGYESSVVSGIEASEVGDQSMDDLKAAGEYDKEEGSGEVIEDVLLSDQILKAGDTMQIMYPKDEVTLYHGLDITLHGAKLFDSPEAAGLDRTQMLGETENYDLTGDPGWCGIDEGRILVCDLTVKNVEGDLEGELHISEIMVAYADPNTQKVTMISCTPAYFSASSSQVGASDYYHYQIHQGESKTMTVAYLIQKEYEAENVYLCVTYDAREPKERQYFRMVEQE